MKKIVFCFALLFTAILGFSETRVLGGDSEEKNDNSGLQFSVGDLFYYTERFDAFDDVTRNPTDLYAKGFSLELGFMNSDEDGIFDWVTSNTLGFSSGRVNTEDNYSWIDSNRIFSAGNDAKFHNIFLKNLFGPQINFFILSAGLLFGSNVGFDWLKMSAEGASSRNDYTYKERRIFVDFAFQPYISVNLLHFLKIYLSSEFDFPILRARFIRNCYEDYLFKFDWFDNDIPINYKVGVVLFF